MAKTNKKKSNSVKLLVVAIVVVIAAIGFVVYDEWASHSALFESDKFATAVADALDTTPASLDEKKLSEIKYIELNYDADAKQYYVAVAKDDFVDVFTEYIAKTDEGAEDATLDIEGKFTDAVFELEEGLALSDLKYFTGLEVISASNVPLNDSAVFANMKNLTHVYVSSCGLTEVNGLASLNAENVYEVNLAGNDIADWSALNYIEDKVIVSSTYSVEMTEDGNYTFVPVEQTLADYNAEQAEAEEETSEDTTEEAVEEATEEATEETVEEVTEEVAEETVEEEVTEEVAE